MWKSDEQWATEVAKLKVDLERFTGGGLLDVHAICDQRDAAVQRAQKAERELAAARELITLLDAYINLLGKELGELVVMASIRGWKSELVAEGVATREKIAETRAKLGVTNGETKP